MENWSNSIENDQKVDINWKSRLILTFSINVGPLRSLNQHLNWVLIEKSSKIEQILTFLIKMDQIQSKINIVVYSESDFNFKIGIVN